MRLATSARRLRPRGRRPPARPWFGAPCGANCSPAAGNKTQKT